MKNSIKLLSIVLLLFGCAEEEPLTPNPSAGPINTGNTNNTGNNGNSGNTGNTGNSGSIQSSIYYFRFYNLRSLDLDNQGGGTFTKVSEDELTNEIYGIAYDPSDSTFFGWTDYWDFNYTGEYYESYNPYTKEKTKVKIGENTDYHSVCVNTKLNKKILVKYEGSSLEKITFQEVSSQGIITFESPIVDLGEQVSKFVYVSSLDAFVAIDDGYGDLNIAVVDANTYTLNMVTINVDVPSTPIGQSFNSSDLLYDKQNDIIYYLRSNGLYTIDISAQTAQLIQTDWISFFQSQYNEDLDDVKTIYYPPTNEIVIQGSGFWGSSTGSSKFFAIDVSSKKAREINTVQHTFDRVYGFAVAY